MLFLKQNNVFIQQELFLFFYGTAKIHIYRKWDYINWN